MAWIGVELELGGGEEDGMRMITAPTEKGSCQIASRGDRSSMEPTVPMPMVSRYRELKRMEPCWVGLLLFILIVIIIVVIIVIIIHHE